MDSCHRLLELDSLLSTIENWLNVFQQMKLMELTGMTADVFNKFTQCLVVLFKINTLDETGWDTTETRRRADVFQILDTWCDTMERIPDVLGLTDAKGERNGLFFRSPKLLKAIRAIFVSEMSSQRLASASGDSSEEPFGGGGGSSSNSTRLGAGSFEHVFEDDLLANLWGEPSLQALYQPPRDYTLDSMV